MRPSTRIAAIVSWLVFLTVAVYAWNKVLSVPDGRGDVRGLALATLAGAIGLGLLGDWLRHKEGGRRW